MPGTVLALKWKVRKFPLSQADWDGCHLTSAKLISQLSIMDQSASGEGKIDYLGRNHIKKYSAEKYLFFIIEIIVESLFLPSN